MRQLLVSPDVVEQMGRYAPDVDDHERTRMLQEAVRDALEALPADLRGLVDAIFYEGLSYNQVGRRYAMSRMSVARRLKLARDLLEEALGEALRPAN